MVSKKEAQELALYAVHERFMREPELIDLRLKAFNNLQDYWRAYYQAIHVQHPGYMPLVATLMTQNPENIKTNISGPVP